MIKQKEEILAAAASIRTQAEDLPAQNFFGDDNAEEKAEMLEWARQLEQAADGKAPSNEDVNDWLSGKWSSLSDLL